MGMLEEIRDSHKGWAQAVALAQGADWPWEGALFLGSGSSYYLGRTAAWLARRAGFGASALPSGEVLLHPEALGSFRSVVGVSRSGRTTELLEAVRALGLPGFLVTTHPNPEAVGLFQQVVVLSEAQEEAIVQTRSFSSALVFFLARFLGKGAVEDLPELFLQRRDALWQEASSWPRAARYFILGTGAAWGLAQEAALKLKETALVQAEAFHTLEFRHGPMSLVDEDAAVFLLLEEGGRLEGAVGEEMARLGAKVREVPYTLPTLPLALVPFQFLAYQLALEGGRDPERPRHLSYAVQL